MNYDHAKLHCIIDSSDCSELGSISFLPKKSNCSSSRETGKLITTKRALTRDQNLPAKKPNIQPKVSKSSLPKLESNQDGPLPPIKGPSAPKIDVTSLITVVQNLGSDQKLYKCSFCGSECALIGSMKRHIETKHLPSTVSFDCRQCDYKTKLKFMLKKHYTNKHQMPEMAAQGMMAYY